MLALKSPLPLLPGHLLSGIINKTRHWVQEEQCALEVLSIENVNDNDRDESSVYLLFIITMSRQFFIMSVIKYFFLKNILWVYILDNCSNYF